MKLSIIIPTRNRSSYLRELIDSLLVGCSKVTVPLEIIVVDNGSDDETKQVTDYFATRSPFPINYYYMPCPGLHVGRNLGARVATGEILSYLDDDVVVEKEWAQAILNRFASDNKIGLVGGPCLPLWNDAKIPQWLESFRYKVDWGWVLYVLSLVDLGPIPREIPGGFVFGCNFSVRRDIVLSQGGFHPDGMPRELLHYRGDGETAMAVAAGSMAGMKVFYEPKAAVYHRVPPERLTREYVLYIAERNGVGSAYAKFRFNAHGGVRRHLEQLYLLWKEYVLTTRYCEKRKKDIVGTDPREYAHIRAWHSFTHYLRICLSPQLAHWVTQESYFAEDPCPYYEKKGS